MIDRISQQYFTACCVMSLWSAAVNIAAYFPIIARFSLTWSQCAVFLKVLTTKTNGIILHECQWSKFHLNVTVYSYIELIISHSISQSSHISSCFYSFILHKCKMIKEPNDMLLFLVWLEQWEKKCNRKAWVNEDRGTKQRRWQENKK